MIPQFEEFLYPFLVALKNGSLTTKEMKAKMIEYFNLTAEDCATMTKGGNTNQLSDRIGWCRQYFRRALFIEIPQRGTYAITQRGMDYLASHTSLYKSDLMQYPEFAAYATSTGMDNPPSSEGTPELEKELTPTESLEKAFNAINNDLAEELLATILEQSPTFFENLVLKLLEKMGYGKGVVTQRTGDEGIDGGAGINKGVFITTSSFTKEAMDYKSSKKIAKIDGKQLTNLMIQYNVGVTTEYTYEVKRIDKDFFEE